MNDINFEQVSYDNLNDIRTILTNAVHTHLHWHTDLEIAFVCQGALMLDIHGEQRLLGQGEIAVINSEELHSVNSNRDEPNSGVLLLQIGARFFRGLHMDIESILFDQPTEDSNVAQKIRRLMLRIIDEIQARQPSYEVAVYGYCANIIALLSRHYALPLDENVRKHRKINAKSMQRLKNIFIFVREHYNKNPSIGDIAAVEYVSPYYLSHFFTKSTGMTYSQYLNSVKVDMVQQDLIGTEDSVTDIMLRHGFTNAKTFHRIFKLRTGCSPTEYRRSASLTKEAGAAPGGDTVPEADIKLGSYVNFQGGVQIPISLYRETDSVPLPSPTIEAERIIPIPLEACGRRLDRYFLFMTAVARASDLLRSAVRDHLRLVHRDIGFQYIRFHNIFGDEMGVLDARRNDGRHNFTYIDEVLDFLMEIKLKPFLELSFMPAALASGDKSVFFYKANITPPKDYAMWAELVRAFTKHIIARYSLEVVQSWYFEVWNEPNLPDFWTGTFEEYFELYRVTVTAVKQVNERLRVGGPTLNSFQFRDAKKYLAEFLDRCAGEGLPVDFVSGHPYPAFYYQKENFRKEVLCGPEQTKTDMSWIRRFVDESAYPEAEIHLNEWNSSSNCKDLIHDTAFMANFVLHNYIDCQGLADSLTFWAATDLFEESSVPCNEFHGGFGLLSKSGLKKPQYFAFMYLARLSDEILTSGEDYIVTRNGHGIQILAWNYCHYNAGYADGDKESLSFYDRYQAFEVGSTVSFRFQIPGEEGDYEIEQSYFDRENGSVFDLWLSNGSIEFLTPRQLEIMKTQNHMQRRISIRKSRGILQLEAIVQPFGFVFIEAKRILY